MAIYFLAVFYCTLVTLASLNGREFLGFVIQARVPGTAEPIGSFDAPTGTQRITCSGISEATVST